jgi:hypothetical protein
MSERIFFSSPSQSPRISLNFKAPLIYYFYNLYLGLRPNGPIWILQSCSGLVGGRGSPARELDGKAETRVRTGRAKAKTTVTLETILINSEFDQVRNENERSRLHWLN